MRFKHSTSSVTDSAAAAAMLPKAMETSRQERFVVLSLNSKHQLIGKPSVVAIGTVNMVEVHPRDVFYEAIRCNAVAIIVAHNHPSGDAEPSIDDQSLTRRLVTAGALLGITVLDHIIVGGRSHVSLAERGLI